MRPVGGPGRLDGGHGRRLHEPSGMGLGTLDADGLDAVGLVDRVAGKSLPRTRSGGGGRLVGLLDTYIISELYGWFGGRGGCRQERGRPAGTGCWEPKQKRTRLGGYGGSGQSGGLGRKARWNMSRDERE